MNIQNAITEQIPSGFFTYIQNIAPSKFQHVTAIDTIISQNTRRLQEQEKGNKRYYTWQQILVDAAKHSLITLGSVSHHPSVVTTSFVLTACSIEQWSKVPKDAIYRQNLAANNPTPYTLQIPLPFTRGPDVSSTSHDVDTLAESQISLLLFWDKSTKNDDQPAVGLGITDPRCEVWVHQWTLDQVIGWYQKPFNNIQSQDIADVAMPTLKTNAEKKRQ